MATPNDIYNEIDRINNAKQGIAEAIEEKGVEVPAGSHIEGYPGLVRQIQTGSQEAVLYTPQELDENQQAQARENIAAQKTIDELNKLDYSLLENTPTIPDELADLESDADHRVVTDLEIEKWNGFAPKMYLGVCETGGATSEKEATTATFPVDADGHPVVGTMVGIKYTNENSASNLTLNVNGTGAYPIYYSTGRSEGSSNIYGGNAGRFSFFVFDGEYWVWFSYGYDANTDVIGATLRKYVLNIPFRYSTWRFRLLFTSPNGRELISANKSTSTSETEAKTPIDDKIDPFGPIYYYSTTPVVNAGEYPAADYMWQQRYNIGLGYSFSDGRAWTLTIGAPIYLKCAPQSDGMAIIDATTPIVQALPATDDGNIYILLGYADTKTRMSLYMNHPVYYIKNGARRVWTGETI